MQKNEVLLQLWVANFNSLYLSFTMLGANPSKTGGIIFICSQYLFQAFIKLWKNMFWKKIAYASNKTTNFSLSLPWYPEAIVRVSCGMLVLWLNSFSLQTVFETSVVFPLIFFSGIMTMKKRQWRLKWNWFEKFNHKKIWIISSFIKEMCSVPYTVRLHRDENLI